MRPSALTKRPDHWTFFLKVYLLGTLAALTLKIINFTLRWSKIGFEGAEDSWPSGEPRIICFWHGRQLFMPWIYRNCLKNPKGARPIFALISSHNDGRIIARAISLLGLFSVSGSSSRGGREALFALIKTLKGGSHVAITPDGPKGPAGVVKVGVVKIAQKAAVPVYPVAVGFERFWKMRSWDGMLVAKPFSRAVLAMGKPMLIPAKSTPDEDEAMRIQLEKDLRELTEKADTYF